jgi:hypothetical protein
LTCEGHAIDSARPELRGPHRRRVIEVTDPEHALDEREDTGGRQTAWPIRDWRTITACGRVYRTGHAALYT